MPDLRASKEAFAKSGGKLHHKGVQSILADAERKARLEAERFSAPPNRWAAERIVQALGWLAVVFFFVMLIGGTAALLIIIPAAEYAAVYAGLFQITPNAGIAGLTTAALFIGTIVLMFLKNVFEDALPHGKPETGLRRIIGSWGAWFGHRTANSNIVPFTSIEQRYLMMTRALGIAKFAILFASLVGRLTVSLEAHADKPVSDFLTSVRDTLTGQELIGAVVSLLVLFAILRILDVGVLFAYTSFKNTAGRIDLAETRPADFLETFSALREEYQARALDDLTIQLTARNNSSENSLPPSTTQQ